MKNYVRSWLSSSHKFLWKAVSIRYNVINWSPEDLNEVENVMQQPLPNYLAKQETFQVLQTNIINGT